MCLAPSRQMGAVEPLTAEDPTDPTGLRAPIGLFEDPQLVLRSSELAEPRLGYHLRIRRSRVHGSGPGVRGTSLRSAPPTAVDTLGE